MAESKSEGIGFSKQERAAMNARARELAAEKRADKKRADGEAAALEAMPAYAWDGKVLCFFQAAEKFESRYATFGFNDIAKIDDGNMWPTSFGLVELGESEEKRIVKLLKKAVE